MTKTGGKRHIKRIAAPKYWQIPRKHATWTVRVSPGPHQKEASIPLALLLRDYLGYAQTMKEVKRILVNRYVKVDGRVRTDYRFPVGHQDVVELVPLEKFYRIVYTRTKGLMPVEVSKEEAGFKLCKIMGKRTIKGGQFQISLHDGRNILVSPEDATKYATKGSVKISIPEQEILEYFPLEENKYSIVTAGRNMGYQGTIVEIHRLYGPRASNVLITAPDGHEFRTAIDYVFVTGDDKPVLTVSKSEEDGE